MNDCALVVLHARGRRLAKRIRTDGSVVDYDDAKHFDAVEIGVRDLDHLAERLTELLPLADRCIVRGSLVHGSPATRIRRLLHPDPKNGDESTLYEVPRRWVAIDVDGVERPAGIPATDIAGCAQAAIQCLPAEFHGRRCVAVATGSHGVKRGIRMRLWYWLAGAATRRVLQPWFFGIQGVDLATFRPVQCIYTAAPVLAVGVADPVPDRLVALPGEPLVPIRPLPPPVPREARGQTGQAGQAGRSAPPSSGCRSDRYRDAALAGIKAELLRTNEGQRHHALVAAACRMFELGSLSDADVDRVIGEAAVMLNGRGSRQIDPEEVADALDWARAKTRGRIAA